jgi:hypothetical protein
MLYRNRFYHVELGRFINRDPIWYDAGDVNLYRYIFNRTVVTIDSYGLQMPMYPYYYPELYVYDQPYPLQKRIKIVPKPPCGKRQSSKPFETNGCTGVPDSPFKGISFTPACNEHDRCYETCGTR